MTHAERARRRQRMAAEVGKGKEVEEVAAAFGVGTGTVRASCLGAGVALPAKHSIYRVLADLLNTDDEVGDIASRQGITRQRVYQVLWDARAAGIEVGR